jgi:predicted aldo/keto reductase-like oxidoreductase
MEASVVGLGAEHLDGKPYEVVKETFDAAMEHGMNIVDVFMPGHDIRQKIGRAIKGNRDKFIIQGHIGSTDLNQQYDISRDPGVCARYFENLMADLGTDYMDFGMLFFIDSEKHFDEVFNSDIVRYAQKLKRDGVIRAIGASSHNPVTARKVVETGIVELLMFSINPAFDMTPAGKDVLDFLAGGYDKTVMLEMDAARQDLYRTCEKLGVPITVMKTYGGGKLLSPEHSPFSKPLTPRQCIHYALTRPAVASALIGCQNRRQVEEAVAYLDASPSDLDYTDAIRAMAKNFKGACVYCNHCQPCPAHLDIAAVMKHLDIAVMDETASRKGIGQHYQALSAHASDCLHCGDCETKCPFGVPVREKMRRAARVFGK